MPTVLTVAVVVVVGAVVVKLADVCPGLELPAPLRPLLALLPFRTVLRGVPSLAPGGGVRRLARVVEIVTAVPPPPVREPTRL